MAPFTFLGHTFKESYDPLFVCCTSQYDEYDESLSNAAHVLTVRLLVTQSGSTGMEVTGKDCVSRVSSRSGR